MKPITFLFCAALGIAGSSLTASTYAAPTENASEERLLWRTLGKGLPAEAILQSKKKQAVER